MNNLIIGAEKPDYAKMPDKWSYCELKDYFDGMAGIPFKMAACSFLSNVEGLGDYFDAHVFFDFQAYLVLASAGISEDVMFAPGSDEYDSLRQNIEYFMSGKYDDWTCGKKDAEKMKADCKAVYEIYFKGENS